MNVKLSSEPCLFCNVRENTIAAKGKSFQVVVCQKHLIDLMKKEEGANAPAQSGGRGEAA